MTLMGQEVQPAEILLIEDNPVDILMTRRALQEDCGCNNLHVVEDGEEAMDFLHQRGRYADAPLPDLILLDLNLPKKSGREILAEIKQDPALMHIPVVVLTTSQEEKDILLSYKLHANCFITKPMDLEQFIEAIKCVGGFWFTLVKLPPRDSQA
jgi:chemotaxis family two-component system response regulator Rcp1